MPHFQPQRPSILEQEHSTNYQTFLEGPNNKAYQVTSDDMNTSEFGGVDIAEMGPDECESP